MILFGTLAVCGLFMALLGLYGVVSYSVVERTHELGIRMALGATKVDVIRLIMKDGVRLTGCGVVLGLLLAYGITRGLPPGLIGTNPVDLLTYTLVAWFVSGTALLAAWLPARRAVKIDPMEALRYE